MDKIIVKGLKIYAYHGVNPEEKEFGQNFVMDITAFTPLKKACVTDCIDDTVSYAKIAKAAVEIFTSEKNDLLERAAYRVAKGLLERFETLDEVNILLKKPDAPVKLDFEYMAVEISLNRSELNE